MGSAPCWLIPSAVYSDAAEFRDLSLLRLYHSHVKATHGCTSQDSHPFIWPFTVSRRRKPGRTCERSPRDVLSPIYHYISIFSNIKNGCARLVSGSSAYCLVGGWNSLTNRSWGDNIPGVLAKQYTMGGLKEMPFWIGLHYHEKCPVKTTL